MYGKTGSVNNNEFNLSICGKYRVQENNHACYTETTARQIKARFLSFTGTMQGVNDSIT